MASPALDIGFVAQRPAIGAGKGHFVVTSERGCLLVGVYAHLLDQGLAHHAEPWITPVLSAFASADGSLSSRFASLLDALQVALTELERAERIRATCNVLAAEIDGESGWEVARLGGERVVAVRGGDARVLGEEQTLAAAGLEGVVTGHVIPTVRWRVAADRNGPMQLHDETSLAAQARSGARVERHATHPDEVLVVLSHAWWTDAPPTVANLPRPSAAAAAALYAQCARPSHAVVVLARAQDPSARSGETRQPTS